MVLSSKCEIWLRFQSCFLQAIQCLSGVFRPAEVRVEEFRLAEVRPVEVRRAEVRRAEVRTDIAVLVTPGVLGIHPLIKLSDVIVVRHESSSSDSSPVCGPLDVTATAPDKVAQGLAHHLKKRVLRLAARRTV